MHKKKLAKTPFHDVPFHMYVETFLAMVMRNDKSMVNVKYKLF